MAVRRVSPPRESIDALNSGIANRAGVRAMTATPEPGLAAFEHALRLYHLGLNALVSQRSLAAVEYVGWHYLLGQRRQSALVLEAAGRHRFSMTVDGPYVAGVYEAIKVVELITELDPNEYHLAALQVPGVSVFALWLRGEGDAEDWVVPVGSQWRSLAARLAWRPAAFCESLLEPAQKRLEFESRRR